MVMAVYDVQDTHMRDRSTDGVFGADTPALPYDSIVRDKHLLVQG